MKILEFLAAIYARLFSRGPLSQVNYGILTLALRARGYGNSFGRGATGELFFIKEVFASTNPELCIDVGANEGRYTRDLLDASSAKVICFEPLPQAFRELEKNTAEFRERVVLENKGVGRTEGNLTIHYNPSAPTHASFLSEIEQIPYISNLETCVVEVVTLDGYCRENQIKKIDLIKVDVEGFESEVLEGAREVLTTIKPKFIQLEMNWHQLLRNTSLNYFAERLPDYDVYQLLPGGWVKRDPSKPENNIYKFANFIFVLRALCQEKKR